MDDNCPPDVESTKPEPDLVHAALQKAGAGPSEAVMIGDTPFDVDAAKRAGVPTLAVLTGGFSEQELRDAGARDVYESVDDLRQRLDQIEGTQVDSPAGRLRRGKIE